MAQVGRALNPHLYLSSSSPRFSPTHVSSTRPQHPPLPNLINIKTPRSLNITLAHKHIHTTPSALVLDAPPAVSSSSSSDEEEVAEKQEEDGVWKYPFSDIVVKERRKLFDREWTIRDVVKASVGVALHALCLLAPFTFTWGAFTVAMTLLVFTGLGITLSYHRNLSHRSFKLPQWLEYFWAYCGTHALQGSPMTWASIHRTHHLYTDKEGDPHSPIEGFWFSQINWIFDTEYFHKKQGGALSNVGDMDKQPFYRFIEDTYIAHPIALAALLYAVGGLPWLVWGMGVRSVLTTHGTYLVNSGLHIWGSRAYNTDDNSHNNWIMAFFTFGEGWHNNHHAFEFSARHGFEWWEIDVTWYVIKMLDSLGLVKDIKLPTEAQKKKMLERWV